MPKATRQPIPMFLAVELGPVGGAEVLENGVPQLAQNLALLSFANPQFGQYIFFRVSDAKNMVHWYLCTLVATDD